VARTIRAQGVGGKLLRLSDGAVFNDGEYVVFTVVRHDGKKLRVNCSLPELGDTFCFLGQLARIATESQDKDTPRVPEGHNYLAPIPAQGMGFQAGDSPDETLLVMRLFGFDLGFSVPSNVLVEVADDIARIARTLSAGSGKPQ
jgi:hypothetical protein